MRSVLLVVVVLLTAGTALGQTPDLDRARRHFEAGSKAYAKGDYPAAELEFRSALEITGDPLLYYNIAQSQQRQGHLEDAITSYKGYLAGVPDAEDRADVERRIRQYEAQLQGRAGAEPASRPGPASVPAGGGGGGSRRLSAWLTGGGAIALLAVGVTMSALSSSRAADGNGLLSSRDASGQPLRFTDIAGRYHGLKDDAATYGGVAVAMYVAAAAAAGASIYLFLSSRSAGKERPRANLRLTPALSWRAAGLTAGLEF